jgi:hypothetical protein
MDDGKVASLVDGAMSQQLCVATMKGLKYGSAGIR